VCLFFLFVITFLGKSKIIQFFTAGGGRKLDLVGVLEVPTVLFKTTGKKNSKSIQKKRECIHKISRYLGKTILFFAVTPKLILVYL